MATAPKSTTINRTGDQPVLRPGRPADPPGTEPVVPDTPPGPPAETTEKAATEVAPPAKEVAEKAAPAEGEEEPSADDMARATAQTRQRQRRRLIRQCERLLLLDFNMLAMPGWPDSFLLAKARRRRDLWIFSVTVAALVFFSGMTGFVPAWIAGTGFGAAVLIFLAGLPPVRRLYAKHPSYLDLIFKRQRLLRQARRHAEELESDMGLAWLCVQMSDHNHALRSPRFASLVQLSEQRVLPQALKQRAHMQLYLVFMLEAEKAYERLQQAYFSGHQEAIDRGWATVAEEAKVAKPAEPMPPPDQDAPS